MGIPVLGICYGMQLAAEALGGKVQGAPAREFGRAECQVLGPNEPLFHGVPHKTIVWMSHGDQVQDAGPEFVPLAVTATCPIAAVKHRSLPFFGLQFHPEVSHTPYGSLILGNFLDRICKNPRNWTMGAFIERSIEQIVRRVGPSDRVVCGLSGGVDSAVCAALLREHSVRGSSASSWTPGCSAPVSGLQWPRPSVHERMPSCGLSMRPIGSLPP